jgi:SAM-dependent methyltransferase
MNGDITAAQRRLGFYRQHFAIEGKSILELGTGHTPEVLLLAREQGAERCVGLDVERLVEPKGVRDRGVELDLYDGATMPYPDSTFDVLWSSDVLEHVRDPERTLKECSRVLKPGGFFAAIIDLRDHYFLHVEEQWLHCLRYSDLAWRAISSNRSSYINRLSSSHWTTLVGRAGFALRVYDRQQSPTLRRLHREGRIPAHGFPLEEDDVATYRLEIVAVKGARA